MLPYKSTAAAHNGHASLPSQALLLSSPVLIYEGYFSIIPVLETNQRRTFGVASQPPLAVRRVGVIDGSALTRHWRYATVILAVIAAAIPWPDPATTGLETAPLVILFLASIVLLKIADRHTAARTARETASPFGGGLDPT